MTGRTPRTSSARTIVLPLEEAADHQRIQPQDGKLPTPRLAPSRLGPLASVIGAAALPLHHRFFL